MEVAKLMRIACNHIHMQLIRKLIMNDFENVITFA